MKILDLYFMVYSPIHSLLHPHTIRRCLHCKEFSVLKGIYALPVINRFMLCSICNHAMRQVTEAELFELLTGFSPKEDRHG